MAKNVKGVWHVYSFEATRNTFCLYCAYDAFNRSLYALCTDKILKYSKSLGKRSPVYKNSGYYLYHTCLFKWHCFNNLKSDGW